MQKIMFRTCSYSETGEYHISVGRGCEDAVVTGRNHKTGVTAAVVCDGAGSCIYAQEGSEITARTALEVLLNRFDELYRLKANDFAEILLTAVCEPLQELADERECDIGEFSATLVCAVMSPDGRYLYFHVGDGIVAACDMDGDCRIVSQYYHDIAPNYTTFVTIPDTAYNYGKGRGGVAAFLLTSDGPEYLMTSKEGWLNAQAELLLQMSIFFSPKRMEQELSDLTTYYKELGMYDDSTYAMLADSRYAPYVFDGMDESLRNLIFYLPEHISKRVTRQMLDCFLLLAAHPEGVPEKMMARALHTHSKWNTFHKLAGLITAEAIRLHEGKYYFCL